MSSSILYPFINGVRHSFSSIELKLGNQIFTGFKSINYSRKRTRTMVRGNSPDPLAKTRGDNEYTADCELYLAEWNLFQAQINSGQGLISGVVGSIGGVIGQGAGAFAAPLTDAIGLNTTGYGDQLFSIHVTYTENGFTTITDILLGCTVDSTEASQSQSADALVRKIDLGPLKILYNGIDDLLTPLIAPSGS